ncbi:MAG: response regulator [Planctomycetes bacterium]|nr:response regulator [Planctomycetota bacterium]
MEPTVHVLLIEDNPGDMWLFREAVRRAGLPYRVTVAADGEEALATLHAAETAVDLIVADLIVVDLNLPRMSGRELLARLRADPRLAKIPLVILTSSTEDTDLVETHHLPADAYFVKPHDFHGFDAILRRMEAVRRREAGVEAAEPPPAPAPPAESHGQVREKGQTEAEVVAIRQDRGEAIAELRHPLRVLIVEDNPGDVVLLRHMLAAVPGESLDLTRAATIAEALEAMEPVETFDMILLDLDLPDSRGLDTVRRVHDVDGDAPIIVLTGHEGTTLGVEAVRLGAQDYLVKGRIDGWGLWRAIRYAMERKRSEKAMLALMDTLEQRVAERTAEAVRRAEQIRALAVELTGAEQRERRRLAHLLHDHLQQLLVAIRMRANGARGRAADEALRRALGDIDQLVGESLDATRELMVDLSPPVLERSGLAAGMAWLAEWMRTKHGLEVHLDVDPDAQADSPDLKAFIFRTARELLFNVVKHAGVSDARLVLARADRGLRLAVCDHGRGFNLPDHWDGHAENEHFGLATIRDRLSLLGGTMDIVSAPDQGTTTTVEFPARLGTRTS